MGLSAGRGEAQKPLAVHRGAAPRIALHVRLVSASEGCAGKAGLGFDRSAACGTSSSDPGSRSERGPEGPPRDRSGAAEPVGGTARLPPDGPRLALPAPASRSHAALPCRRAVPGMPPALQELQDAARSALRPPPLPEAAAAPLRGPVPRFWCQRLVWSWTDVFKNEADRSPREQAL